MADRYRVLVSDFDDETRAFDIKWKAREFRWEGKLVVPDEMNTFVLALAKHTGKSPHVILNHAATHCFPDHAVEVLGPEKLVKLEEGEPSE